jgi:hypothetical protein
MLSALQVKKNCSPNEKGKGDAEEEPSELGEESDETSVISFDSVTTN